MTNKKSFKVKVFDTTLRDGEQSPGAAMSIDQKLHIARQLEKLGVDVIEAGFPAASPGDFEAVSRIAKSVKYSTVAALARCGPDVETTCRSLEKAAREPRIHVFIATSDIHMKEKLGLTKRQVLKLIDDSVREAKRFTKDVQFSAEDASRSDEKFLIQVFETAALAGATTINIPDTVGYAYPEEFGGLVSRVVKRFSKEKELVVSVHCHDDLGMAVANSISGIVAGARQVECTINGIGERAGNASLEEIVMAIHTRGRDMGNFMTNIKTKELLKTSKLVAETICFPVPPNKAIIGENAFAHAAGIHQHGMMKNRGTYEIMTPQSIGWRGSTLTLSKHSGRHALAARLKNLGYKITAEELSKIFLRFKKIADHKRVVGDEDLRKIL